MESIDCVIIGAGVIGLAVARRLALAGREVIVLEREAAVGLGVSSRNSEVIHAGMYYPEGSAKARFCVEGNRLLRAYAGSHGVPHEMVGKLIVATSVREEAQLATIAERGRTNGVVNLRAISGADARALEPRLSCTAALLSPDTGIIDAHAYMLALQGDAEANGAVIALGSVAGAGEITDDGVILEVGPGDGYRVRARTLIIAAGLSSCPVARGIGLPGVPTDYLCKGSYFSLTGKMPFSRLVYPVPVAAGLGIHYTLDMGGRGRFGPDVQWVEAEDYGVEPSRSELFYDAIRRYWPGLPDGALEPGYAGIRPKISGPSAPAADFSIAGPRAHGVPGVVALYGIESPGLTSSLAIAEAVFTELS